MLHILALSTLSSTAPSKGFLRVPKGSLSVHKSFQRRVEKRKVQKSFKRPPEIFKRDSKKLLNFKPEFIIPGSGTRGFWQKLKTQTQPQLSPGPRDTTDQWEASIQVTLSHSTNERPVYWAPGNKFLAEIFKTVLTGVTGGGNTCEDFTPRPDLYLSRSVFSSDPG